MDARRWKLSKTVYDYSNETAWDGPDLADDETVEVVDAVAYDRAVSRVTELETAIEQALRPTHLVTDARDSLLAVLKQTDH